MTVDRFGNPHAPNLSYARGEISIRADGRNLAPSRRTGPLGTGTAARQEAEQVSPGTAPSARDQRFESGSLQRGVCCEPGRVPDLRCLSSAPIASGAGFVAAPLFALFKNLRNIWRCPWSVLNLHQLDGRDRL